MNKSVINEEEGWRAQSGVAAPSLGIYHLHHPSSMLWFYLDWTGNTSGSSRTRPCPLVGDGWRCSLNLVLGTRPPPPFPCTRRSEGAAAVNGMNTWLCSITILTPGWLQSIYAPFAGKQSQPLFKMCIFLSLYHNKRIPVDINDISQHSRSMGLLLSPVPIKTWSRTDTWRFLVNSLEGCFSVFHVCVLMSFICRWRWGGDFRTVLLVRSFTKLQSNEMFQSQFAACLCYVASGRICI